METIESLQLALAKIREEERQEDDALRELLTHRHDMEVHMSSLQRLVPTLAKVQRDAAGLAGMVGATCALAENVSSKVRELDLIKGRLKATLRHLGDIMDIKGCVEGVREAMAAGDFVTAAGHVHRYLIFDKKLLVPDPGAETEGDPLKTMAEAHQSLCDIVNAKFDEAVEAADQLLVDRYFKLFPLVGLPSVGLEKYGRYIAAKANRDLQKSLAVSPSRGVATIGPVQEISMLLEHIAQTIEATQPVVETNYGPGHLIPIIEQLLKATDALTGRILDSFYDARRLRALLDTVRSEAVTLDPKDLDSLIGEIKAVLSVGELFLSFVRKHLLADVNILNEAAAESATGEKLDANVFLKMVSMSHFNRHLEDLSGHYVTLEDWFLRSSVQKAIKLSRSSVPNGLSTSSLVDDTFFVLQLCAERAVRTGSTNCVCAMLNQMCTLLDDVYKTEISAPIKAGLGMSALADITGALQGTFAFASLGVNATKKAPATTAPAAERNKRAEFLVAVNNLQLSHEYTLRFMDNVTRDSAGRFGSDQPKVDGCISSLADVATQFERLVKGGLERFVAEGVSPRVGALADAVLSSSYVLTDDDLANFDTSSTFMAAFVVSLGDIVRESNSVFTEATKSVLMPLIARDVADHFERVVLQTKFNRLGGLQFDKDLRVLVTFLSNITQWSMRDKFVRLSQMATLLTLERETEIYEYWGVNAGTFTWLLTPAVIRSVLRLRVDFNPEDIKKLNL